MRNFILFFILILFFACSNPAEPELKYIVVKMHEYEIFNGQKLYYISYHNTSPISASIGPLLNTQLNITTIYESNFEYYDMKFHCRKIDHDFIEVARK